DAEALKALATIQREEGDVETLDRSLERLLAIEPDDVAVLREQALLLTGTDEERVTRNHRRLEALGIEFDASLATTKLSEIVERAREVNKDLDPRATEPETSAGWLERAAKLLMIGEIAVALESVEKALQANPDNGEAWMLHAKLLSADVDRTKEALQSIRRATALGEYGVLLESEIFENDGRLDAARAVLEDRLETNPEDAEARARLSLVLLRAGAIEWSRKVLDESPPEAWEHASLHVMDGRLHLVLTEQHRDDTGQHDQLVLLDALVAFDGAIDRDRESGLAWLGRAKALRYQDSFNEADIALTRARRLIPEHPSIPLEEAQLCLDLGRLEQADTLVAEAATQLNDHVAIPFIRGMIAAHQNRLTEAQSLFTKVLASEPGHVRARLNRCSAALLKGDLATALDDADHLVGNHPNLNLARLRRSEILMNHGDWDEAEAELRRLIERRPEHTMALVHLGTCLIARGRPEQAEKPLNAALQIDPTHSDAWYQRGLLYLDFGRLDDATHDFENAAEHDEHHIDARLRIAAILHEGRDPKKAAAAWRRVLDADPEHRLARRRLEECKDGVAPPKPGSTTEG
ncbi:MAG TPA: tetratricopeptide repeat protein, partial [Candidatus Poseidoniales archaeon]|nr:tetratricopeptide repeat protein [Candidatus Poseidoniales archaeon]